MRIGDTRVGLTTQIVVHVLSRILVVTAGREVHTGRKGRIGFELRILLMRPGHPEVVLIDIISIALLADNIFGEVDIE